MKHPEITMEITAFARGGTSVRLRKEAIRNRKSAPAMPLIIARDEEESGIYRRKMPMVPKMSMDAHIFSRDERSFLLWFISGLISEIWIPDWIRLEMTVFILCFVWLFQ